MWPVVARKRGSMASKINSGVGVAGGEKVCSGCGHWRHTQMVVFINASKNID